MPKAYSYVRLSTAEQLKGHGAQRQAALTDSFVQRHGLELDDTLDLRDYGVSAFTGGNLHAGLGAFRDAVEDGSVEPGSYLVVESLDRISREPLRRSISVFLEILNAGIFVATVDADRERVYGPDSNDLDFMEAMLIYARANEESENKSRRVSAAWEKKREKARENGTPLTQRTPGWININTNGDGFVLDKYHGETVQSIFQLAMRGWGTTKIAKELNALDRKSLSGKAVGWGTSTVQKILENRSVIGEFQPFRTVRDKTSGRTMRVPDGDVIENYYPEVISSAYFYAAKEMRSKRKVSKRGRAGEKLSNVFVGLVRCGYCQSPMHYVNKGKRPKGGNYLACSNAIHGKGCIWRGWRYEEFEKCFLEMSDGLDIRRVLGSGREPKKLKRDRVKLGEMKSEFERLERTTANILSSIEANEGQCPPPLFKRLQELEERRLQVQSELVAIEEEIDSQLIPMVLSPEELESSLSELLKSFEELEGIELYALRLRLHRLLIDVVERISVYPAGGPRTIAGQEEKAPGRENRHFVLRWKTGEKLWFFPEERTVINTTTEVLKVYD